MNIKKTIKFKTLYNTLTDIEKNEFYEFLNSSLSPKLHVPRSIIENFKPGNNLSVLQFDKLSSQSIWNINSQLSRALEMFFAIKELTFDQDQIFRLSGIQMQKRNLNKIVSKKYLRKINEFSNSKIHEKTFRIIADTCREYLNSILIEGNKKQQSEVYELYNNFLCLNLLFELIIMRFNNEVTSFFKKETKKYFLNDMFNYIDIANILEMLKNNFPRYYPVIRLWNEIYELYSMKFEIDQYHRVKNNFFDIMDQLSDELKTGIFNVLTDLLILKREKSGIAVDRELFEIFSRKEADKLNEDIKLNKIGYNHFRDNIFIALKVGEIEWAEYFLKKYSDELPENQKDNDVNTGKALICFSKGQYNESLTYIKKLKKSYFIHYSDYFRISMKANFELANYNECILIAEKFKEYLKRNKDLPDQIVKGSKLFIKNLVKLSEYKITSDKKYLKDIELPKLKNSVSPNNWLEYKFSQIKF